MGLRTGHLEDELEEATAEIRRLRLRVGELEEALREALEGVRVDLDRLYGVLEMGDG